MDFEIENHGGLFLLRPLKDAAREYLESIVSPEAQWWAGALVVEPRYIPPIAADLELQGFTPFAEH